MVPGARPVRYQVITKDLEVKEADLVDVEDRYIDIVCRNPEVGETDCREREAIAAALAARLATGSVKVLSRTRGCRVEEAFCTR